MKKMLFLFFLIQSLSGCGQNIDKPLSNGKLIPLPVDTPSVIFTEYVDMIQQDGSGEVTSIWKNNRYSIEKTIVGFWEVNTWKPVTPALVAHLKKADGVEEVFNEKRYSVTIYVAKMHEYRACDIISKALDSFKE